MARQISNTLQNQNILFAHLHLSHHQRNLIHSKSSTNISPDSTKIKQLRARVKQSHACEGGKKSDNPKVNARSESSKSGLQIGGAPISRTTAPSYCYRYQQQRHRPYIPRKRRKGTEPPVARTSQGQEGRNASRHHCMHANLTSPAATATPSARSPGGRGAYPQSRTTRRRRANHPDRQTEQRPRATAKHPTD
jgi:hypothetical protein